jgi:hypothetical protein
VRNSNFLAFSRQGSYFSLNNTPQATSSNAELNTGGFLFARAVGE